jgi:hypothetical protein
MYYSQQYPYLMGASAIEPLFTCLDGSIFCTVWVGPMATYCPTAEGVHIAHRVTAHTRASEQLACLRDSAQRCNSSCRRLFRASSAWICLCSRARKSFIQALSAAHSSSFLRRLSCSFDLHSMQCQAHQSVHRRFLTRKQFCILLILKSHSSAALC